MSLPILISVRNENQAFGALVAAAVCAVAAGETGVEMAEEEVAVALVVFWSVVLLFCARAAVAVDARMRTVAVRMVIFFMIMGFNKFYKNDGVIPSKNRV